MDPDPSNFPILSYVMSKLPSFGPLSVTTASANELGIERPTARTRQPQNPHFEITDRMPHLTDPNVVVAMRLAIVDVAQTRSLLKALGDRPDHEMVDTAKAKLAEIDVFISKQLDEMVPSPRPLDKDEEWRKEAEKERESYKAVIELDEMHQAYEVLLKEAERRLGRIYDVAVAGGDVAAALEGKEDMNSGVIEEVNEEIVAILQETLEKGVERVDLSSRQLNLLPEAFGRICSLVVLNLSNNELKVSLNYFYIKVSLFLLY